MLASESYVGQLISQPENKQFAYEVEKHYSQAINENVIRLGTESEYTDENVIDDDDDSSHWEGEDAIDEKPFQRVVVEKNLDIPKSGITVMVENHRAERLGNHASQSTSALTRLRSDFAESSMAASPNESDDGSLTMKSRQTARKPINVIPRSSPQPIVTSANHVHAQAALSPKTTRRNMLATELTESLRRHLLWERQQKSSSADSVLKRRHTSHDVANLKRYPERACLKKSEDANARDCDQYLTKQANNGYHSKGW